MISRVAVSLIICASDSAPTCGRIGNDYQPKPAAVGSVFWPSGVINPVLGLFVGPTGNSVILAGFAQHGRTVWIAVVRMQTDLAVQPKPAYSLTASRLRTSTGFSPRRGRKAAGPPSACDPLRRFLLARALRGELPDDAALLTHQGVVSVNLAGKSRPAASEMFQSLGFSLALR